MADQRLVLGLSAWLRDSDVPPPDARMSASRVVAGVESTARLRRFWPPARLVREVQPAAELGAYGPKGPPQRRAVPQVARPQLSGRLREVVTPVRALAATVVVALVCTIALIGTSLGPQAPPPEPEVAPAAAAAALASPLPDGVPLATPTPTPEPTPTPTPTPEPVPTLVPSDRALDWHEAGVRLETDVLKLVVGNQVFMAVPGEDYTAGTSQTAQAQLEVHWSDGSSEQELLIELAADDGQWWLRRVRTLDGRDNPRWVIFDVPAATTRTPMGESFEGDLKLKSTGAQRKALREPGSATLRLLGLRLTAFGEPATY